MKLLYLQTLLLFYLIIPFSSSQPQFNPSRQGISLDQSINQSEGDPKLSINLDQDTYVPGQTSLILLSGNLNETGTLIITYVDYTIFSTSFANLSLEPVQVLNEIRVDQANGTYVVRAWYTAMPEINVTKSYRVINENFYTEPIFKYRGLLLNVSLYQPRGKAVYDFEINITNLYTGDSIYLEDVIDFAILTDDVSENRLLFIPGQTISIQVFSTDGKWEGVAIFPGRLDWNMIEIVVQRTVDETDRIRGLIVLPILAVALVSLIVRQKFYGRNKYSRIYTSYQSKNENLFNEDEFIDL